VTDNEDFVIPSLSIEESDQGDWEVSQASAPQPPPKVSFQSRYSILELFTKVTTLAYLYLLVHERGPTCAVK
jgi:hypothetical protein